MRWWKEEVTENILKMLQRIKTSGEGTEFIEYLSNLSRDNYEAFKKDRPEYNEFHKGYAFAIDNLLDCFKNCDIALRKMVEKPEIPEGHY